MSDFHINSFWILSHHEKLCTPNLKISIFLKVYVNKIQSFWDKADSRKFLFGKYYLPKVVNCREMLSHNYSESALSLWF